MRKGTAMQNKKRKEAAMFAASSDPSMGLMGTYVPRKASQNGVIVFGLFVFVAAFAATLVAFALAVGHVDFLAVLVALVIAALVISSVHVALSWEKVVVLRLGKLNRVVGPGLFFTIPFIEFRTIRVDQRTIATPFFAERTLTADLVPVNIDAVLYWVVRDAEEACVEVEDYFSAVIFLAQTALRDAVGRSTVAEVAMRRDQLDSEIQADIEKEAAQWGIDIISVKVRDIVLPVELQESMALEAQADRVRNARMTVAGAELDLAEILAEAAQVYGEEGAAMKLRTMLMQYDTVNQAKSTVVTVPSALSDGFAGESKIGE